MQIKNNNRKRKKTARTLTFMSKNDTPEYVFCKLETATEQMDVLSLTVIMTI